jgi:hypothetical protein
MVRFLSHLRSSSRSDCLASPGEEEWGRDCGIIVIVVTSQYISNRFVLLENKTMPLGPHAFFQVTNPSNVLFCSVAQLVCRATVNAVVSSSFPQAVGYKYSSCHARTFPTVLRRRDGPVRDAFCTAPSGPSCHLACLACLACSPC